MKVVHSHSHSHDQSNGRDVEQQQHGTMSLTTTTTTTVSIGDPWEVQYARFFNCPLHSTHHPTLLPLAKKPKNSWISSSSLASLKLLATADHSVVLTVTLLGHVIEEHYISKLNFTWPQVSCLTGYSPRGSKIVFMSYKDQVGQIQKFVVRFLTIDETERFINFLKEAFGQNGSTSGIYKSKTSSESEFIPSFEAENRPIQNWDLITTSAEFSEPIYRPVEDSSSMAACDYTYIQPFYPIENHDGSHLSQDVEGKLSAFPPSLKSNSAPMYRPIQDSSSMEDCADTYIKPYYPIENHDGSHLSQDVQAKISAFPPSFTSLLTNCFPVADLGVFQATDPEDVILKRDIMKYLEDASFQETLSKVQKVVNELGGDLLL